MVGAQMITILVQLASIVTLSRLLPAEDFGVIAMIVSVTAFLGLFRDLGLSTASIQKGNLSHQEKSLLFWLNAASGAALAILVAAIAPALALFFDRPELRPVAQLLATTFLISSLGAQHSAVMQRELRFAPKVVADVVGAVANMALAVALALLGFRYWALAWGIVAGTLVTTVLYMALSGFRPGLPARTPGMRSLLGFGASVTAFELANYVHRNLDNVLIGRVWGASVLGLYSRAYQIMMLPITCLRTPINAVALPVLARLQNDPAAYSAYFRNLVSALAFLSMPLMLFIVINATDVVALALGKGWLELVPILVLLGISGFIQPVAGLRGLVLLSLGRSRRYMMWGFLHAIAVSMSFGIGVAWGGVGVAAAYALCNYALLYPSIRFVFRDTPLQPSDLLSTSLLPCAASLVAAASNWLFLRKLPEASPVSRLIVAILVFGTCYLIVFLLLPRGRDVLRSHRQLLNHLRG